MLDMRLVADDHGRDAERNRQQADARQAAA
jgi:hypothetical protein